MIYIQLQHTMMATYLQQLRHLRVRLHLCPHGGWQQANELQQLLHFCLLVVQQGAVVRMSAQFLGAQHTEIQTVAQLLTTILHARKGAYSTSHIKPALSAARRGQLFLHFLRFFSCLPQKSLSWILSRFLKRILSECAPRTHSTAQQHTLCQKCKLTKSRVRSSGSSFSPKIEEGSDDPCSPAAESAAAGTAAAVRALA
eukprot:scaffold67139_cov17-Tisochrysis_lutea.AAC.1